MTLRRATLKQSAASNGHGCQACPHPAAVRARSPRPRATRQARAPAPATEPAVRPRVSPALRLSAPAIAVRRSWPSIRQQGLLSRRPCDSAVCAPRLITLFCEHARCRRPALAAAVAPSSYDDAAGHAGTYTAAASFVLVLIMLVLPAFVAGDMRLLVIAYLDTCTATPISAPCVPAVSIPARRLPAAKRPLPSGTSEAPSPPSRVSRLAVSSAMTSTPQPPPSHARRRV